MRPALSALLLALSPSLMSISAAAEDLPTSTVAIEDSLFTKHSELKEALKSENAQQDLQTRQEAKIKRLSEQVSAYQEQLASSKAKLDSDFKRLTDDPNVNIEASQSAYQIAWSKLKQAQKEQLLAQQEMEELELKLTQSRTKVASIEAEISGLKATKQRVRANLLTQELKGTQDISVSFTNRCQASMTLTQCDQQTKELALQKAVKQFSQQLIEQTTEYELVKKHLKDASLNIHVIGHSTSKQGFYDGERYRTQMAVELEARPTPDTACTLLAIDRKYCFAEGNELPLLPIEQEIAWVTLTVRSNLHNDNVSVAGVSYGSTPVEIMLPTGSHTIVITKEGYQTFSKQLNVDSDSTLRAVLAEKRNELREGTRFSDSLANHKPAPAVVTLLPGTYYLGENAANQVEVKDAFAIGATPITVEQFRTFVEQTGYQTDAELTNTCTTLNQGQITPVEGSNWRTPGFKQYNNSPVVCISQNDANSYVNWLSNQTKATYRLPSEAEWEIAARAGSQSKYWWGDNFVAGAANTGWSGTPWANESTAPVSAFKPNKLGVYDAVGNVWQWTNSPTGVAKGGAWNFSPDMAAAGKQLVFASSSAANYVGFRVLREID